MTAGRQEVRLEPRVIHLAGTERALAAVMLHTLAVSKALAAGSGGPLSFVAITNGEGK